MKDDLAKIFTGLTVLVVLLLAVHVFFIEPARLTYEEAATLCWVVPDGWFLVAIDGASTYCRHDATGVYKLCWREIVACPDEDAGP